LNPEHEQVTGKSVDFLKFRSRNQLLVFVLCFAISAFIWFLIVLSKETNTTIEYPIVFENIPGNLVLVGKTDSLLSLSISKGSISLITMKYLGRKTPLKIDLSQVILTREGNYFTSTISTSSASRKIVGRLNLPDDHIAISPESITLRFETISGLKVKVIPKLVLEFDKQYQLSQEMQAMPDSVTIVGPREVISKIEIIETTRKEIRNINKSQTVNVSLALPENTQGVKCIPENVNVVLKVDKFTESEIEVPVVCTNTDTGLRTYPDKVKITYFVTFENFKRIEKEMFLASVSYVKDQPTGKLKVDLRQYPSFVKIIKIEPEEVEFLLLK
jgi:hypothetical protein